MDYEARKECKPVSAIILSSEWGHNKMSTYKYLLDFLTTSYDQDH